MENDYTRGLLANVLRASAPFGTGMAAAPLLGNGGIAGLLAQQSFAQRMRDQPPPQRADTARGMLSADFGQGIRPDDPRIDLAMALATTTPRAGFNVTAYKGTYPYDPETVPDRDFYGRIIRGADRVPQEITRFSPPTSPHGGFFSDSPAVASRFANLFDGGAVYPVSIRFNNPMVIEANGRPARDFQFGAIGNRVLSAFDNPAIDGVILRNTADEGTVYVPRLTEQIRSRFAPQNP